MNMSPDEKHLKSLAAALADIPPLPTPTEIYMVTAPSSGLARCLLLCKHKMTFLSLKKDMVGFSGLKVRLQFCPVVKSIFRLHK